MGVHPPKLKARTRRPAAPPERYYQFDEFVARLLSLEGRTIQAVHYYDNNTTRGFDTERWDRYGDCCDIIHAVELLLDDGEVFAIQSDIVDSFYTGVTWLAKKPADCRGLQASNYSILETDECRKYDVGDVWDVSHHSRWMEVLQIPVAGVGIFYGPCLLDGQPSVEQGVMDLALDFTNGRRVYLAGNASELAGKALRRHGADVVVVFGDDEAPALGVGAHASPAWLEHGSMAPALDDGAASPALSPALAPGPTDRSRSS